MPKLAHLIYGVIKSEQPFDANFNHSTPRQIPPHPACIHVSIYYANCAHLTLHDGDQ